MSVFSTLFVTHCSPLMPLKTSSNNKFISGLIGINDIDFAVTTNPNESNFISDGVEITTGNKLKTNSIESTDGNGVLLSGDLQVTGTLTYNGVINNNSATGGKYSQTGGDITVENTTTKTSIINTGAGSLVFGADSLTPGDNYHVRISGDIDTDGKDEEILFEIKLGNEVVSTTTFIALDSIGGLFPFELEIDFTVRTIGANCEIVSNSQFVYNKNSGDKDFRGWSSNTSSVVDSTVSNTMTAAVQWDDSESDNKVRIIQFLVTKTF